MLNKLIGLLICASAFAADCNLTFTFVPGSGPLIFNNKSTACYNWQLTYYSSGFSAVSIELDQANDAGTTPGSFSAMTAVTGVNPGTSTTAATSTFQSAPAWLQVNPATLTGTGIVTGRLLGAQLTSASVNFLTIPQVMGQLIPPIPANMVKKSDFGTGSPTCWLQTNISSPVNGIIYEIGAPNATGCGGSTALVICDNVNLLPAAPWTITAAFMTNPLSQSGWAGIANANFSTSKYETVYIYLNGTNQFVGEPVYTCDWTLTGNSSGTNGLQTGCASAYNAGGLSPQQNSPLLWLRIHDNGTKRCVSISRDGTNFPDTCNTTGFQNHFYGHPSSDFTGSDHACIVMGEDSGNFPMRMELLSWQVLSQ